MNQQQMQNMNPNMQMPMNMMGMNNQMQQQHLGNMQQMMHNYAPQPLNNQGYHHNRQPNLDEINDKYKTQRCRHYESHKACALGDKCHFAHEDHELRKPGDPINPEMLQYAMKSQQYQNCN